MRELGIITDPVYVEKEHLNSFERSAIKYLSDVRDLPFIYLCLKVTFIQLPFAILLFTPLFTGWIWITAALVYAGLVIYNAGPFTLMLHNTSHRKLFKKDYDIANYYIPWVLSFFMGQSPETYLAHHIGMHHKENNLHEDLSSTMRYQRDSIMDFLKYLGRFMVMGVIDLVRYFRIRNLNKLANIATRGEVAFILLCILLGFINLPATILVLVLPAVVMRFLMMAGNWAQHAFIDQDQPENSYRNSITCINSAYNKKCYNDGYHIGHHLRPNLHWTEMPTSFLSNNRHYIKEEAIVYEGLDYFMIWLLLMFKRYDVLANHYVNLGGRFKENNDVQDFLRSRTRKFHI